MNAEAGTGQGNAANVTCQGAGEAAERSRRAGSVRVLLADGHSLVRQGLGALLARQPGIEVVGDTGVSGEVVAAARAQRAEVVLLGILLRDGGGVAVARELAAACPRVGVIGVSMYTDRPHIEAMLRAGAKGYVTKHAGVRELAEAISAVSRGRQYLCPWAAAALAEAYVAAPARRAGRGVAGLTPRERQVLQWVAEGQTSKQIAQRLKRSVRTADACRQQLMEKLGVQSVAELTRVAMREGVVGVGCGDVVMW